MAGYTHCQVIGYFGNECGTVAFSKRGSPNFIGYGPNIETAISKAIASCTKDALPGLCRIVFIPVCVGPGVVDQSNIGKTPAADLERWSARFDTRDYWGILGQ